MLRYRGRAALKRKLLVPDLSIYNHLTFMH